MFPLHQRRSVGLGACSAAERFEGAEPRAETVLRDIAEMVQHSGLFTNSYAETF
jgi:hypothetical protein